MFTSELQAHWLSECFLGTLALPEVESMRDTIARRHDWEKRVFPDRSEGYFLGLYVPDYIDELMEDLGCSTCREDFGQMLRPVHRRTLQGTRGRAASRQGERGASCGDVSVRSSRHRLAASSAASRPVRAWTCSPMGRPFSAWPAGRVRMGWPVTAVAQL